MCAFAFPASVKSPVDSITISTLMSFHGSFAGSRSAITGMVLPPMMSAPFSVFTENGARPYTVSYFKRYARFSGLVRSFTATTSISCLPKEARKKLRPILPKPLIANRVIRLLYHACVLRSLDRRLNKRRKERVWRKRTGSQFRMKLCTEHEWVFGLRQFCDFHEFSALPTS